MASNSNLSHTTTSIFTAIKHRDISTLKSILKDELKSATTTNTNNTNLSSFSNTYNEDQQYQLQTNDSIPNPPSHSSLSYSNSYNGQDKHFINTNHNSNPSSNQLLSPHSPSPFCVHHHHHHTTNTVSSSPYSSSFKRKQSYHDHHPLDINRRDEYGRTPLIFAVSMGSLELVQLLLEHPKLNINAQDVESGYSALHKALYAGDLMIALTILRNRQDVNIYLKDREGNTCLDLLNSTIDVPVHIPKIKKAKDVEELITEWMDNQENGSINDIDDDGHRQSSSRSKYENEKRNRNQDEGIWIHSVWTWGSNSNFTLGHKNQGDRTNPEILTIPMAIPSSNLHHYDDDNSCDHIEGEDDGRKQSAQKMKVNMYSKNVYFPMINKVVMGKYHTAIIANHDCLYVHGHGPGGRLGLGHEVTCQTPQRVQGIHGGILDIALGHHHSISVTKDGAVYTWGSNNFGQLGYGLEQSHTNEARQRTPREVGGALKKVRIVAVAASKYHSAAISEQGLIYTWGADKGQLGYSTNGGIQLHPKKISTFSQTRLLSVAATNSSTSILTASHDVFVFAMNEYSKIHFPHSSLPRKIQMHHRQKPPAVVKIVSGNHQYAALTDKGEVYLWTPPEEKQFMNSWQHVHFHQKKPQLVWSVRRHYQAARDIAIGIDSSILLSTEDGHVYLGTRRNQIKQKKVLKEDDTAVSTVFFKFNRVPLLQHIQNVAAGQSGGYAAIRSDGVPSVFPRILSPDLKQFSENMISTLPQINSHNSVGESFIVFHVKEIFFHVHAALCIKFSPFIRHIFNNDHKPNDHSLKFNWDEDGILHISLPQVPLESVHAVTEFIYTGKVNDKTLLFVKNPQHTEHEQKIRDGIFILFKSLHMGSVEQFFYAKDVETSFDWMLSDVYLNHADLEIVCQNGSLRAHQPILRARCPFFRAALEDSWLIRYNDKNERSLHLSQYTTEIMSVTLHWIYGLKSIFDDLEANSVDAYLQLLLDILSMSSELLLEELQRACERVLVGWINLSNVLMLMEVTDIFPASILREACLSFVCWNIETLIEFRQLEKLDDDLILEIQKSLRENQAHKFPETRGTEGFYARIQKFVSELEKEKKQKRREEYEQRKKLMINTGRTGSFFEESSYKMPGALQNSSSSFSLKSGGGVMSTKEASGAGSAVSQNGLASGSISKFGGSFKQKGLSNDLVDNQTRGAIPASPSSSSTVAAKRNSLQERPGSSGIPQNLLEEEMFAMDLERNQHHQQQPEQDEKTSQKAPAIPKSSKKTWRKLSLTEGLGAENSSSGFNSIGSNNQTKATTKYPALKSPTSPSIHQGLSSTSWEAKKWTTASTSLEKKPSLLEIMEKEEAPKISIQTPSKKGWKVGPLSPSVPSATSDLSSSLTSTLGNITIKSSSGMSQKERRKSAKLLSPQPSTPTSTDRINSPWGSFTATPTKSLLKVQKEEEEQDNLFKRQSPMMISTSQKSGLSGIFKSKTPTINTVWNNFAAPTSPSTNKTSPKSPFSSSFGGGIGSEPARANEISNSFMTTKTVMMKGSNNNRPVSLLSIQQEQYDLAQQVTKAKKPLRRIQIEEKAICELEVYYEHIKEIDTGEWITIRLLNS